MEKIITYETLRSFAYSNDKLIQGKITGIVVDFYGLGDMRIHNTDPSDGLAYAKQGIIYLVPYYNPWSWMNEQAVAYTDELICVLCEKYRLDSTVKIVSMGYSMGGLSALVYCVYAKITPVACVAICPPCDLPYHFTERSDLPRTLYSAFGKYNGDFASAMRSCSPLHLVDKMPNIRYTLFHSVGDEQVSIEKHSIPFVKAMQKNHNITFTAVPLSGHCQLTDEAYAQQLQAIQLAFQ